MRIGRRRRQLSSRHTCRQTEIQERERARAKK